MPNHAIDLELLKDEIKVGNIKFYVKDGIIYCQDKHTFDTFAVGAMERKQAKHIQSKNTLIHAFDFKCPTCGRYLELPDHYCSYCGQPLKYE